ncbi:MAG: glycosyltransferase family 2 protein [Acidobacteriota bacterium]|nr:glycosyltransferase family 2 protein [Acidobacteriota bacterium]
MLQGKRIVVVLPAYNAAATLERTYREIPQDLVDEILLVDDASQDETVSVAEQLGVSTFIHPANRGYGGNQKTCYREGLKLEADVFIMLHPDYQYTPKLIPAMASMVVSEEYDLVLGSRILGGMALKGGMPLYKYIANRFLTSVENMMTLAKLSEYHTGYRAFSRRVLETLPLEENSDDFVFDNQFIVQALYFGFGIGEVSCPTRYFPEASMINFSRSIRYGLGVLWTGVQFRLQKWGLARFSIFDPKGRLL